MWTSSRSAEKWCSFPGAVLLITSIFKRWLLAYFPRSDHWCRLSLFGQCTAWPIIHWATRISIHWLDIPLATWVFKYSVLGHGRLNLLQSRVSPYIGIFLRETRKPYPKSIRSAKVTLHLSNLPLLMLRHWGLKLWCFDFFAIAFSLFVFFGINLKEMHQISLKNIFMQMWYLSRSGTNYTSRHKYF